MIRASFAIHPVLVLGALAIWCPVIQADGGRLRASEKAGPWRISVFTSPTPLRAGRADVSVLVQRADSQEIVRDVAVEVEASHAETGRVVREQATAAAATNKLLQAAVCHLPTDGRWQFSIIVGHPRGEVHSLAFEADVAPEVYGGIDLGLWIAWPVVPIGLFVIHQMLARRRQRVE